MAYVEARHGDARQALEAIREKTLWEMRNRGYARLPYGTGAFNRVGRHDLVALCEGNMSETSWRSRHLFDELHKEEIAEARRALGDGRFEQLVERGAALGAEDFGTMLLHEIDATLAGDGRNHTAVRMAVIARRQLCGN